MNVDKTYRLDRYIDVQGIILYSVLFTFDLAILSSFVYLMICRSTIFGPEMLIFGLIVIPFTYLMAVNISWRANGSESIRIDETSITLTKSCFGFSRTKIFERRKITQVKIVDESKYFPNNRESLHLVFLFKGTISFNYEMANYGIGYRQNVEVINQIYHDIKS